MLAPLAEPEPREVSSGTFGAPRCERGARRPFGERARLDGCRRAVGLRDGQLGQVVRRGGIRRVDGERAQKRLLVKLGGGEGGKQQPP